jgi:methyl-accepting chemotaxis protein
MSLSLFSRPSVARRLALGFGALVVLTLAVAAFCSLQFRATDARLRQIVEVNQARGELAHGLLNQIDELAIRARTVTLLSDVKEIDAEMKGIQAVAQRYGQSQKALADHLAAHGADAGEQTLLAEIAKAAQQTIPLALRAAQEGQDGASAEATLTLTKQVRPAEQIWRGHVQALIALEGKLDHEAYTNVQQAQARAQWVAAALVLAAIALGSLVGWRITRGVKQPIDEAMRVAERIAEGDLSTPVTVRTHDEIGRLLAAVGAMQERLRGLVGEIRRAADSIEVASAEVAGGNQDLSQRTEQTASSLQQAASSMTQLTGTVRQSAEAAAQANQLADSASSVARRGGAVVGEVVSTMDQISTASRRIADIIGVIDGIAFQTNILALLAAVEAARAGEQGRGFAVVAGEVRSLAQRSAEAAKEIKSLIGSSVERVEAGGRLVQEAGGTMNDIVASVQRVSDIIGEISAAAGEQSSGIGQVSQSVTQLDAMTQQNAALVEQSAAAAESLREQSQRLSGLVSAFRLQAF